MAKRNALTGSAVKGLMQHVSGGPTSGLRFQLSNVFTSRLLPTYDIIQASDT